MSPLVPLLLAALWPAVAVSEDQQPGLHITPEELWGLIDRAVTAATQPLIIKMDSRIDTLDTRLDTLDSRLDTLTSRMDTPNSRLESLDSRLDTLDSRLDTLDSRLDTLDSRMDAPNSVLDSLDSRLDTLHTRLDMRVDTLGSRLDALHSRLDTLSSTTDTPNSKLDSLDSRLDTLDSRLDTLDSRLDVFDSRVDTLTEHRQKQDLELESINGKLDHQSSQLEEKADQLDQHRTQLQGQESRLDVQESQMDSMSTRLDRRLDEHDGRLTNFSSQLGGQASQIDDQNSRLDNHNTQIIAHQAVLDGHSSRIDDHKSRLDTHLNETEIRQAQIDGNITRLNSLQTMTGRRDCSDLPEGSTSGVYLLQLGLGGTVPVPAFCDLDADGGRWTVFQRRADIQPRENFYRGWTAYRNGFGEQDREFWWGLEKLWAMTSSRDRQYELRIDLEDFEGEKRHATYQNFRISSESDSYRLTVTNYTGNAEDSLATHNGMRFTTKDRDNDKYSKNCAEKWKGGWWYNNCHYANLNGLYLAGPNTAYAEGVNWYHWRGYTYSLKTTTMKIRPTTKSLNEL